MQARTFKKSFWCHVNHLHLLMVDIKGIVWVKYFFKHHRRLLVVGLNTQVLNTKLIHVIKSKKKKKRPQKEKDYSLYSPLNGIPLLGAILNVALSSYDIINWVKCLKIKQFMGVLSKVQINNKQRIGYYVIIQNYNKILKRDWLSLA